MKTIVLHLTLSDTDRTIDKLIQLYSRDLINTFHIEKTTNIFYRLYTILWNKIYNKYGQLE